MFTQKTEFTTSPEVMLLSTPKWKYIAKDTEKRRRQRSCRSVNLTFRNDKLQYYPPYGLELQNYGRGEVCKKYSALHPSTCIAVIITEAKLPRRKYREQEANAFIQ